MKQLKNQTDILTLNERGCITSFCCTHAPGLDFIQPGSFPSLSFQYRLRDRLMEIESVHDIPAVRELEQGIEYTYTDIEGTGVTIVCRIQVRPDSFAFTFSLKETNGLCITGIAYPFLISRYQLEGTPGSEALLYPLNAGLLKKAPQPRELEPDSFHAWRFTPENGDTFHYPGQVFAQFLAYYNDRAGMLAMCDDTEGALKLIKPVHRSGLRLGFFHAGDWRQPHELGYTFLLRSFRGDWYNAADIYRRWSSCQPWSVPLEKRPEIPGWLLDSPVHVILRIQGRIDEGPVEPNECFQPYEKAIPLLEQTAEALDSPIAPIIMAWEKKGPWVYPDCFPPAGGDESLRRFTQMAREHGWHVGSYCNGTRWVTEQYWSGYDGHDYFLEQKGGETLCRTVENTYWQERWDTSWRHSYAACLEVERTRKTAEDFCLRLAGDGLDYIQFLDQNVGCTAFPCYAEDHGHPPMPGQWMTKACERLGDTFRSVCRESGRPMAFALEQPCCEYFLRDIHICDVRVGPPGHPYYKGGFIPLAQFLHHEYILFQGAFGCGQEPYHLPIRTAANFVWGNIPGGVLTGDGDFVNRDHPQPWGVWEPKLGNNSNTFAIMKSAAAVRRGAGRPYLVYGRMQKPAHLEEIRTMSWQYGDFANEAPAVFDCLWEAPDGRLGLALANWTEENQTVYVNDARLGTPRTIQIPALSCLLEEAE